MACCECCCPPGKDCCKSQGPNGICCDPAKCCGTENNPTCCASNETCCGTSCCPDTRICCEGVCCLDGQACVDGECSSCPEGQTPCGEECCQEGQACVNGQCVPCPEGQTPCGGQCCPPGEECIDEECVAPCPPYLVCGDDCCEPSESCCDGECCNLSGCYWEFDCAADGAVSLDDGLNPRGVTGCQKIVTGAYDAGVNGQGSQASYATAGGVPANPNYSFGTCPHVFFTLFRNANCETVAPDGSKGGGEVSEIQYKVYRASCSGAAVDVSDEAVADGFRGVIRFEPQDAGGPPCSTPADPPLLDWLSPPALYCPP